MLLRADSAVIRVSLDHPMQQHTNGVTPGSVSSTTMSLSGLPTSRSPSHVSASLFAAATGNGGNPSTNGNEMFTPAMTPATLAVFFNSPFSSPAHAVNEHFDARLHSDSIDPKLYLPPHMTQLPLYTTASASSAAAGQYLGTTAAAANLAFPNNGGSNAHQTVGAPIMQHRLSSFLVSSPGGGNGFLGTLPSTEHVSPMLREMLSHPLLLDPSNTSSASRGNTTNDASLLPTIEESLRFFKRRDPMDETCGGVFTDSMAESNLPQLSPLLPNRRATSTGTSATAVVPSTYTGGLSEKKDGNGVKQEGTNNTKKIVDATRQHHRINNVHSSGSSNPSRFFPPIGLSGNAPVISPTTTTRTNIGGGSTVRTTSTMQDAILPPPPSALDVAKFNAARPSWMPTQAAVAAAGTLLQSVRVPVIPTVPHTAATTPPTTQQVENTPKDVSNTKVLKPAVISVPNKSKRRRHPVPKGVNSGKWTSEEHDLFVSMLGELGSNWVAMAARLGTRTKQQCRSHAQKYWKKLKDMGGGGGGDGEDDGGGGAVVKRRKVEGNHDDNDEDESYTDD